MLFPGKIDELVRVLKRKFDSIPKELLGPVQDFGEGSLQTYTNGAGILGLHWFFH